MRPVTDAFLSTLRGSHVIAVRATVLSTFQTGTQPTGTVVDVLSGAVTLDSTAAVRGTLDMEVDGTGRWPNAAGDLYPPYGNEVFVERGITFGNGTVEYCSLGYFRFQTPAQDEPPDGPIRISAKDRMQGIIDARLLMPVQFVASQTYGDVVEQLVTAVYPDATIEWDDATDAMPIGRTVLAEDKRYEPIDDLVKSVGKVWYWDYRGVLVITAPPDPSAPVWEVNAGAGGVLVSAKRQLTREGVYNAVVATGESADDTAPARGVALDNDPSSPTYYYGRFGPVPQFYSSPLLLSDAQAVAAAETLLRKKLGLPYSVDFSSIPNPALEPLDPVRIRYTNGGPPETHIIERLTIPLSERDPLSATTREQTTILVATS